MNHTDDTDAQINWVYNYLKNFKNSKFDDEVKTKEEITLVLLNKTFLADFSPYEYFNTCKDSSCFSENDYWDVAEAFVYYRDLLAQRGKFMKRLEEVKEGLKDYFDDTSYNFMKESVKTQNSHEDLRDIEHYLDF